MTASYMSPGGLSSLSAKSLPPYQNVSSGLVARLDLA